MCIRDRPTDYVFKGRKKGQHLNRKSVDRVVRRTLNELSIKGASLHSTRRTCLTTLKDKGWQDADIMAVSGHKDFGSLKKYLHTTPKQMKNMINDFLGQVTQLSGFVGELIESNSFDDIENILEEISEVNSRTLYLLSLS